MSTKIARSKWPSVLVVFFDGANVDEVLDFLDQNEDNFEDKEYAAEMIRARREDWEVNGTIGVASNGYFYELKPNMFLVAKLSGHVMALDPLAFHQLFMEVEA